ncbi:MAG: DUF1186 domain-containing protein [Acidobacteria bacterium]|nr:DUF1186 domain-containing protein [Acidobacteriota bacterium]
MDIPAILQALERTTSDIPRAALHEAAARREEITPHLLRILDQVAADPSTAVRDREYTAHLYAMFLLAQFRETRAYPILVRLFSIPGETVFDIAGDVVTEDLGAILSSVSGGDMSGMAALAENESANEYVRSAALKGLVSLVASGQRSRDEVMTYFAGLYRTLPWTPGYHWTALVCCCADLWAGEVQDEIRRAYADGLVEDLTIRLEDVEEELALGLDAAMARLSRFRRHVIEDVAEAVTWWACFTRESRRTMKSGSADDLAPAPVRPPAPSPPFAPGEPVRRTQPKVGRNDPCPCGSGRKYKKCCGV